MDTYPIPAQSLEKYYHVDRVGLERQYKEYLSAFSHWMEKEHAQEWLTFPENMGSDLSIDVMNTN